MATNWFNGLCLENYPGESLCFCNSVTNGLLSSLKVKSKIKQNHCFSCDFLYGMYNADIYPLVKSARPLKALVAHYIPNFRNSNQHDCSEFAHSIVERCKLLTVLTQSILCVTYKCRRCHEIQEI